MAYVIKSDQRFTLKDSHGKSSRNRSLIIKHMQYAYRAALIPFICIFIYCKMMSSRGFDELKGFVPILLRDQEMLTLY